MRFKILFPLFFCCFGSTAVGMTAEQQLVHDRIVLMRINRDISGLADLHGVSEEVSGFMDAIMALQPQERAPMLDDLGAKVGMIVPKFGRHNPFMSAQIKGAFDFLIRSTREDVETARDMTAQEMAPNHGRVLTREEKEILGMIDAIPLKPEIKGQIGFIKYINLPTNISFMVLRCVQEINKLPAGEREALFQHLEAHVTHMDPLFNFKDDDLEFTAQRNKQSQDGFVQRVKEIRDELAREIDIAKNPPPPVVEVDDRLDPTPVVVPLVSADAADGLLAIDHYVNPADHALGTALGLSGAFVDGKKVDFETRLINYAIAHMTAYYKEEAAVWNTAPITARLRTTFRDVIDAANLLDPVAQRKEKVTLVENLLHDLYANQLGLVPTTVDNVETIMDLQGASRVFTRMEAIRELPSVDWNEVVEMYIFDANAALRKGGAENDAAYWRRIGNHVLDIYRAKVKPHICPAGLLAELTANRGVTLVPFHLMYSGTGDASYAFEDLNTIRRAGDPGYVDGEAPLAFVELGVPMPLREEILNFETSAVNLATKDAAFKKNLAQSYQRVEDYIYQTLARLFGTADPVRAGLSWHWDFGEDFSPQRVELCRKALLTFNYFNRNGDHYLDDLADFAAIAGRFTHCSDGKKTAIEATSSRVLCALSGNEADIVIEDFDTFIKKVALSNVKQKTIAELSDHPGYFENVSTVAMIKDRNKAFWGDPTDIVPELSPQAYKNSDYGLGTDDDLASPNTDRVLQYFYQHVYVGPHELVNVIYTNLKSAGPHTRAGFFGFACTMLAGCSPFKDLQENLYDFRNCVKERYCELVGHEDYMFTRKGIETLLFYAKYLAWNGPAAQHPLKVDWEETLEWVQAKSPVQYAKIYKDRAAVD
ncbi:MAG: hypothetical protein NT128_01180 [Proteobacteria bacterium]|nr:hypothetical protein [Pseudomonadota bacterium]